MIIKRSESRQFAKALESYLTQVDLVTTLNHIQFNASFWIGESNMKSAPDAPIGDFYRTRSVESLGRAVATLRANHGMTQEALGDVIDSSRPTISRLENGADVAVSAVVESLTALGYEIILVPRGAEIMVNPMQ